MQDVNDMSLVQIGFHLILQDVLQISGLLVSFAIAHGIALTINLNHRLLVVMATLTGVTVTVIAATGICASTVTVPIGKFPTSLSHVAVPIGIVIVPIGSVAVHISTVAISIAGPMTIADGKTILAIAIAVFAWMMYTLVGRCRQVVKK